MYTKGSTQSPQEREGGVFAYLENDELNVPDLLHYTFYTNKIISRKYILEHFYAVGTICVAHKTSPRIQNFSPVKLVFYVNKNRGFFIHKKCKRYYGEDKLF